MFARLALAVVLLACIASAAQAHLQHTSWTSITWNQRTGNLEITHRLHAQHAQSYLVDHVGAAASIEDLRGRAQIALYVSERFHIVATPESSAQVDLLGAELDDRYLLVYQELSLSGPPTGLDVRADMFTDQFSDQVNRVNIDINGTRQTLQFTKGDNSRHVTVAARD
jgi:hypothetical protein